MSLEQKESEEQKGLTLDSPTELKQFATGDNGELITLIDVEVARAKLNEMVVAFKDIKVTKENYKKEAATAERTMREARYLLQNIHDSNKKILNSAKKKEEEVFEKLIALIEPLEKQIKAGIKEIEGEVKKQKEEEEAREKERQEAIKNRLNEVEKSFLNMLASCKNKEDIEVYDNALTLLEESFEAFNELEFEAKRLHAIFTGRREEVVERVDSLEAAKVAKEKAELEAKAAAEALKQKEEEEAKQKAEADKKAAEDKAAADIRAREIGAKVFSLRKSQLIKLGFVDEHSEAAKDNTEAFFEKKGMDSIGFLEIMKLDEVAWFEKLEFFEQEIKKVAEKEEEEAKQNIETVVTMWTLLLNQFSELGGDLKKWKKIKEIPSIEQLKELKDATEALRATRKKERSMEVKAEIKPFVDKILKCFEEQCLEIEKASFKHEDSKKLLKGLMSSFANSTNEVLGDAMSE